MLDGNINKILNIYNPKKRALSSRIKKENRNYPKDKYHSNYEDDYGSEDEDVYADEDDINEHNYSSKSKNKYDSKHSSKSKKSSNVNMSDVTDRDLMKVSQGMLNLDLETYPVNTLTAALL